MKHKQIYLFLVLFFITIPGLTLAQFSPTSSPAPQEFPPQQPITETKDPFQMGPISNTILLGDAELPAIVANLINIALSLLGIILLVLILYSGVLWMTSGGDEEKTKKARGTLISAVIGLIIILMSGSIAKFLIDTLSNATGGGGGGTNSQF
jgi:hypothetical protein